MVDQRKAFRLISSRDHWQRSSPSWMSDITLAGFEYAQNKFRLCWMILCSSDNHYTTVPQTVIQNIKSKLYSSFLDWKKIFKRGRQLPTKLLSLWWVHFVLTVQLVLTLVSNMTVLHGNHAFSIFVPSIRKRYFSFLENLKLMKMLKISADCRIKTCWSPKRRAILKIPWTIFQKNL